MIHEVVHGAAHLRSHHVLSSEVCKLALRLRLEEWVARLAHGLVEERGAEGVPHKLGSEDRYHQRQQRARVVGDLAEDDLPKAPAQTPVGAVKGG